MKTGYLVLEDGQVFQGRRFGADGDAPGELVFTTGMCGYIETLTDPSYAGQIVMQTYPLIGNVGMISQDFEGACAVRGYVVREYCAAPSNFRTETDLDSFLRARNVPGLWGVDTRRLTIRRRVWPPPGPTPSPGRWRPSAARSPCPARRRGRSGSGWPFWTTGPSGISSGSSSGGAAPCPFSRRTPRRKPSWP